jgi:hypothetical protein
MPSGIDGRIYHTSGLMSSQLRERVTATLTMTQHADTEQTNTK